MTDIIIYAVVLCVIVAAICYIIKQKKSGAACIGCPSSKQCAANKKKNCSCGCNHHDK